MIRRIVLIISCVFSIIIYAQISDIKLEFHTGNTPRIIPSNRIDSITYVKEGIVSPVWNYSQNSNETISWLSPGTQVANDMTFKDGKLYIVSRRGSNKNNIIEIVDAYNGKAIGKLDTSPCNIGTHYISGIEKLGNSIIACNLAAQNGDNLVIYKWDNDNDTPIILLNEAPPCFRIGDAMSVSGDMTNGRIWFVYGDKVYYYTIKDGEIVSTLPSIIELKQYGSSYVISPSASYSNVTVEEDGSFWVSSHFPHYRPARFSSNGSFMEELPDSLTDNQGTDMKIFSFNGIKYAAATTYLNISESSISDGAVSIINLSTEAVECTFPTSGLGNTRNTSFRSSICMDVHDRYYYIWVNIPFQGAACYKYSENESGKIVFEKIWTKGGVIANPISPNNYILFSPASENELEIDPTDEYGITIGEEVDLGLSVNWAGWNLGASSPRGYGEHYAWGELEPRTSNFTQSGYQYYINSSSGAGYEFIGTEISNTKYDAARHKLGNEWRLPTKEEAQELVDSCLWEVIACDTIVGYKITGPNGNSVFFPFNGCYLDNQLKDVGAHVCYWTGSLARIESPESYDYYKANIIWASPMHYREIISDSRRTGHCIRPVKSKK